MVRPSRLFIVILAIVLPLVFLALLSFFLLALVH